MKKEYRFLQTVCIHCGKPLVHNYTGRQKLYCDGKCRMWHVRATRRWERDGRQGDAPGHAIQRARYVDDGDDDSSMLVRGDDDDEQ